MARIRTIKPEFWNNEALSALPEATHMLAAALLNHSDDEGYFNANPMLVKAACTMLREPSVSIEDSLAALAKIGYLRIGVTDDARKVGHIVNFTSHQSINRPKSSKLKTLGINWTGSRNDHCPVSDQSVGNGTGNREQGTGNLCGDDATASDGTASANGSEDGSTATSKANGQSLPESFEDFWQAYPSRGGRKRGKSKCLGIWRQAIRVAERQSLVEAAKHYAASDESTRGFARDPERFLAKEWWRDWIPAIADVRPPPVVSGQVPARIAPVDFRRDPYAEHGE